MTCGVEIFPLTRRVGKIRAVADKLQSAKSGQVAKAYRVKITSGLISQLERLGDTEPMVSERILAFWRAVDEEIARSQKGAGAA